MMIEQKFTNHAIPGILAIDEHDQLLRATVTCNDCDAEIYFQGAHLTKWQPKGQVPVLFLSERSAFQPGKAIRGGVPIIFPWFGARTANEFSPRTDGPSHGFARTVDWQLLEARQDFGRVVLKFELEPPDTALSLGYFHFRLTYEVSLGRELGLFLLIENTGDKPMHIEEALHTYFSVGDVREIAIEGLSGSDYLDKTDGMKRKRQSGSTLTLTGETDRPYLNTKSPVTIIDPVLKRRIAIDSLSSKTTVIWNPWSELNAKMADMAPDSWTRMVCVESANAFENAVVLLPGEAHTMTASVMVEEF